MEKIYITYKGDEEDLGFVDGRLESEPSENVVGIATRAINDIVADMIADYVDVAEVTISIR